jgi:hypothetical protein
MLGHIIYSSYYKGATYQDATKKTYAYCNGQTLLRADYLELSLYFPTGAFGSTATHIHLPDLTNIHLRGLDLGRTVDVDRASRVALSGSAPVGDNLGAYQTATMLLHTHSQGKVGVAGNFSNSNSPSQPYNGQNTVAGTYTTNNQFMDASISGITVSGTSTTDWDVAAVTHFPYIGVD